MRVVNAINSPWLGTTVDNLEISWKIRTQKLAMTRPKPAGASKDVFRRGLWYNSRSRTDRIAALLLKANYPAYISL